MNATDKILVLISASLQELIGTFTSNIGVLSDIGSPRVEIYHTEIDIANPNFKKNGEIDELRNPSDSKEKDAYTQEEWGKIERLVAERGKGYKTANGARKHKRSL
jgi:hypothetical protein